MFTCYIVLLHSTYFNSLKNSRNNPGEYFERRGTNYKQTISIVTNVSSCILELASVKNIKTFEHDPREGLYTF